MATHSVKQITSLINNQIDSHEKIQACLHKAEALAQVALSGNFLDFRQSTINEYLGALHDIIAESRCFHQLVLNILIKTSKQDGFLD